MSVACNGLLQNLYAPHTQDISDSLTPCVEEGLYVHMIRARSSHAAEGASWSRKRTLAP